MVWLIGYKDIIGAEVFQVLKKNNIKFYYTDDEVDYSDITLLHNLVKDVDIKYIIFNFKNEKEEILSGTTPTLYLDNIIEVAKERDLTIITTSINEVFDGKYFGGYSESAIVTPVNSYGKFFVEFEQKVLSYEKSLILRTSSVFGKHGKSYIYHLLKILGTGTAITIVDDETLSPTYAVDLAKVICYLVYHGVNKYGVFHCCNSGLTDWFEYSQEIYRLSINYGLLPSWIQTKSTITPITGNEYKTDYQRVKYGYLLCDKLKDEYNITMRDWRSSLEDFFKQIQRK